MPNPDKLAEANDLLEEIKTDPESAPYDRWVKVLEELSKDKTEMVTEKLRKLAEKDPKYSTAYNHWGAALAELKKYDEAIVQFRRATEINPNYAYAYRNWGLALAEQKKYDEAIPMYRKTAQLDPGYSNTYNSWGNALKEQKKYDEAFVQYRKATELDPSYDRAYNNWANALTQAEKYPEAVEKYLKTMEIDANSVSYENWVKAFDALPRGEKEKATQTLGRLSAKEPKYAIAYNSWGAALANLKKFDEAIVQYRKATETDPKYVHAYYNQGLANVNLKKYDEAIAQYQKAIEVDPSYVDAYYNWGLALVNLKKFDEAIVQYEKAASFDRNHVDAFLAWGEALLNSERAADALIKFSQALQIDPDRKPSIPDRYHYWGNALADQDQLEEALDKFREAIRKDPDYAYSHHNLAYYMERQGRFRESWSQWENAALAYKRGLSKAKEDRDPNYFNYFGWVLYKLGDSDAERIYLAGLELDPYHSDLLTSLVDFYLEQRGGLVLSNGKPDRERRSIANAKARDAFRKAENLLKEEERRIPDGDAVLKLGQLYLAMEDFDEGEKRLLKYSAQDKESAAAFSSLGVLYSRKEEYKKAIDHFREALRRDPEDLTVRSNLAEAYLNAKLPDKAETEYRKILSITANHIESEIGLGQVYLAMAENVDPDLYEEAINHFARAIEIGKAAPSSASKRMTRKDWAAVYYSAAYTRVKLHGSSRLIPDESLLRQALADVDCCLQQDPEHYKAERAKRKMLDKLRPTSTERLLEKGGPLAILVASSFVFVLTQTSFLSRGRFSDLRYYVPMTFGSLIMMIAGLYLPKLLKLKVAGIELEKSSVDQIKTSGTLEISK